MKLRTVFEPLILLHIIFVLPTLSYTVYPLAGIETYLTEVIPSPMAIVKRCFVIK